jgi:hypothetical protein
MAKIPVLPIMAGGLAMYALNEREKAKKAEENKGFDFLNAFSKAVPAAVVATNPGLGFLAGIPGLAKLGSNIGTTIFGPSESSVQSDWLADTANSPAQQSGAFTNDQLWQQKLKHEQWKKDQGRNYNKDYERYF